MELKLYIFKNKRINHVVQIHAYTEQRAVNEFTLYKCRHKGYDIRSYEIREEKIRTGIISNIYTYD